MSFATEQGKISRRKIDLLKLKMDYCANTYGVAPCTASGAANLKCFNTFATCQDTPNFVKTTKDYKFINYDVPVSILNDFYGCYPFIKTFNDLPTEIKEKNTLIKRLKIDLYDDDFNDVNVDKYRSERTSIQGSFWKKFIARNLNYKGRIVEKYEGYEGLTEADFKLVFAGAIENITLNNGVVTIEAVDLLSELGKIDYPLKTSAYLTADLGKEFTANSESAMLALDALKNDYCVRTDFLSITNVTFFQPDGGTIPDGRQYRIAIIAYDAEGRAIGKNEQLFTMVNFVDDSKQSVQISGDNVSGAVNYIYFIKDEFLTQWYSGYASSSMGITLTSLSGPSGPPPVVADRYFKLNDDDPTNAANWVYSNKLDITISDASSFNASGYIRLDKEIIYYASKSGNTLQNCTRGMFNTDRDFHYANTVVYALLFEAPDNPFTLLKKIFGFINYSAYLDTKFTTYETAWAGINFSLRVVAKDTKLAEIYFDLVDILDCMSWEGEDGKIKILKHSETPASVATLDENANIIGGSQKVDLNEDSRKTRWIQYWNRFDIEKGLKEKEAYSRIIITVDTDLESASNYNDKVEDLRYTAWLNDDSDTEADIITYINNLLSARKARQKSAQPFLECEVELKDGGIVTGDLVDVSTSKLQDEFGENYSGVRFRVIKKEPVDRNKFKLKLLRKF